MFRDRVEAGRRLGDVLAKLGLKETVVLALPRGGVPVAAEVAAKLGAPLDLMLVRKIGAPGHAELAVAAIAGPDGDEMVVNEGVASMLGLTRDRLDRLAEAERMELRRRRKAYLGGRNPVPLTGKTVVLVDDGVATGATAKVALRAIRKRDPAKIILAVPVSSTEALAELSGVADHIVCLETPHPFIAVGVWYGSFPQVTDIEVIALLDAANPKT